MHRKRAACPHPTPRASLPPRTGLDEVVTPPLTLSGAHRTVPLVMQYTLCRQGKVTLMLLAASYYNSSGFLFPFIGPLQFRLLLGGVNYIFRHDTLSICIGKCYSGRENGYLLCCPQGYLDGLHKLFTQFWTLTYRLFHQLSSSLRIINLIFNQICDPVI